MKNWFTNEFLYIKKYTINKEKGGWESERAKSTRIIPRCYVCWVLGLARALPRK